MYNCENDVHIGVISLPVRALASEEIILNCSVNSCA